MWIDKNKMITELRKGGINIPDERVTTIKVRMSQARPNLEEGKDFKYCDVHRKILYNSWTIKYFIDLFRSK
jgi:hypothetical protein